MSIKYFVRTPADPFAIAGRNPTVPGFMIADTDAEKPITNLLIGDRIYCKDTDKLYTATSATAWSEGAAGGAHPNLATHDTLGLATDAELAAHAGAVDPHTVYVLESSAAWIDLTDAGESTLHTHPGGGAHPDLATHDALGLATDTELTNHAGAADPHTVYVLEAAVPGGELGGTYATPTVDASHGGGTHAATQSAAEATSAGAAATHAAAADPHTGYLKESEVSGLAVPAVVLGTAAAAGVATTAVRTDGTIVAFDVTVPVTQAYSDAAAAGVAAVAARRDHKHGMPAAGGASGGTPAVVLGTAAAAGAAGTFLRDDDTIVAFDITAPSTQAFGDAAAVGVVALASRRDHKHAMPADPVTAHVAAADPHTAYTLMTELTTHEGAVDPHAGYRLESADHSHASAGAQGGVIAAASVSADSATLVGVGTTVQAVFEELDNAIVTAEGALTTHAAAADPHTGYVKENDANWVDLTDAGATTLHTHAGGAGPSTLKTTANQTINAGAATYVDITGLTFAVVSGVDYAFDFYITFRSAQLTTGWKASVNCPAGTLDFWAGSDIIANGAAGVATHTERHSVTRDDMTLLTATVTNNVDLNVRIRGRYLCTASGTFAARFANELAANTDLVVQKGSWGLYF